MLDACFGSETYLVYVQKWILAWPWNSCRLCLFGNAGPDVGIEAVGFHYVKAWYHRAEMKLDLEADPSESLNEIIHTVRKGGIISDVGYAHSIYP